MKSSTIYLVLLGIYVCISSCKSDVQTQDTSTLLSEEVTDTTTSSSLDTTLVSNQDTIKEEQEVTAVEKESLESTPIPPKKAKPAKKKPKPKKAISKVNPADFKKEKAAKGAPELAFKRNFYDFGEIDQGTQLDHDFIVYNLGTAPLIIHEVKSPCDCTTITYPKDPIGQDQQAAIRFQYNSTTKVGKQNPILTVVTNASPSVHKLYVEGEVLLPESSEETDRTLVQDSIK